MKRRGFFGALFASPLVAKAIATAPEPAAPGPPINPVQCEERVLDLTTLCSTDREYCVGIVSVDEARRNENPPRIDDWYWP